MTGSSMHHLALPEIVPTDHAADELVTPGFWIRIAAVAVDWVVVYAIQIVLLAPIFEFLAAWTHTAPPSITEYALCLILIALLMFGSYFVLFESSRFQGTPGKLLFGLRVTDDTGHRITPTRAWARFAAKQLTWALAGAGYLLILKRPQGQSLHDRIVHTRVMRLKR